MFPTLPWSCFSTNMTESWETGVWGKSCITSGLRHLISVHSSVPLWQLLWNLHCETGKPEMKAFWVSESLYGGQLPVYIRFYKSKKNKHLNHWHLRFSLLWQLLLIALTKQLNFLVSGTLLFLGNLHSLHTIWGELLTLALSKLYKGDNDPI